MTTRTALLAVSAMLLCMGQLCQPPEPSPPTDLAYTRAGLWAGAAAPPLSSLATDLLYTRSGGFAGSIVQVTITPTGGITSSDSIRGVRQGTLSAADLDSIKVLLAGWESLPSVTAAPLCCDRLQHSITYGGRTESWTDGQDGVPQTLLDLRQRIEALASALP